jgi:DGQHR domain-containing protein
MTIKAIKLVQNMQQMYLFVVSARVLHDSFDISRRKENNETNEEGYQRSFGKSRINGIKNYLLQENGIIPNSILVNIDKDKFSFNEAENELTLKEESSIGFIIDGQHRVMGTYNANPDILLPVIATIELTNVQQAQLFIKINMTIRNLYHC